VNSHCPMLVGAIGALLVLGCQTRKEGPPADYASFYQMNSRQWVTKVDGIQPTAVTNIREEIERVPGVLKGSVLIHSDYVAFQTTAQPGDLLEHSRVGSDVTAVLKKRKELQVGHSTTGPQ
jgi:hypothetical protein